MTTVFQGEGMASAHRHTITAEGDAPLKTPPGPQAAAGETPDIIQERLKKPGLPIDFAGIRGLETAVLLKTEDGGLQQTPAVIDASVSLHDPWTRGVHMSRIYSALHDFFAEEPLSFPALQKILRQIIQKQGPASQNGRIKVASKQLKKTKALKSRLPGLRYYPFFYQTEFSENAFRCILGGEILYSSTCPCSAALSREAVHQVFQADFPDDKPDRFSLKKVSQWLKTEKSQSAVPHAQKSRALFQILLSEEEPAVSLLNIIEEMEQALATPVQTAVKREDEMEFARRNGQNMLFCEDAVRRLGKLFQGKKDFLDYSLKVRHYESLHPFTVESAIVKGVKGGFRA